MEPAKHSDVVSIDSGSSYLKAYDGTRAVMFEAVAHGLPAAAPGAEDAITVDGKRYLVGAAALMYQGNPTQGPNREAGFHGGQSQHVQVCRALAEMGVEGPRDKLVVSLPYLRAREERCQEAVKRRREFRWTDRSGDHAVTFSRVVVIPQGVGALRLFERENPDTPLQQVILIDVGSCTTDVVVVRRAGHKWAFVEDSCTSWQHVSTTEFFNSWTRRLGSLEGFAAYPWNYFKLMSRVMEGNLTWQHGARKVDLTPYFDEAVRAFSDQLLAEVRNHCSTSLWWECDGIILTGGGAALVSFHPWADERLITMDAWANAKGQFYHARAISSSKETRNGTARGTVQPHAPTG